MQSALEKINVESLYGLVANAGIGGENTYGENDRWREVIDTNLTGTYQTVQECLPYLKKDTAPFKKVVILSSILARLGVPGYSAYCASKAGLLGLTRSFAAEFSGDKILVNALCPGWVNTDMAQEGIESFADALKITKEQAYQEAMKHVPLGKMSEPEEIAQFIGYLLSEQQTSLTGQTIDINNGALMP
jgi:NAD(P)-dependent dehydrogenase (short-subunit alcohol dehydrogenase family)